jgi:ribonuclease HI
MKEVTIYVDGACEGNPGPGGYGAVIEEDGSSREISGAEPETTNNRMELMAAIRALDSLAEPSRVNVVCDSQYVVRGMTSWIRSWLRKGWKTASGQPVKNRDLWEKLLDESRRHRIRWEWIRGHSGHRQNERADNLARQAITKLRASS